MVVKPQVQIIVAISAVHLYGLSETVLQPHDVVSGEPGNLDVAVDERRRKRYLFAAGGEAHEVVRIPADDDEVVFVGDLVATEC